SHELEDLSVITDTGTDCRVFGSKTQITHVLMNLLVNSSKALNKIPSKRFPEIRISTGKENGRLKVKVWDNGVGVKQEDIPRVFEPFFTSRDVGEGIGLGLSICHTIVKNHGGTITLKSTEGEWTEVAFDLPVADQEG
ncbi:MAG TPA: HAMP domain-containing sensor histidine kinase, partial [Desulfatiglandales bacterium]|nr:HAMP domain-containing sensor histidine kinase [Desulfatiglandales bacterium]